MSKVFWVILIAGVILRLVLASITYHSDIQAFDFTGSVLSSGHILNLYDYLPSLSQGNEILKHYPASVFNYPPLVYFLFFILNGVGNIGKDSNFYQLFLFNVPQVLGTFQLNLHLMLLKIPYLLFDIPIAFMLMKMFEQKWKLLVFTLWMFNPVDLYATYMMGQFDIVPTFFVVLALYLIMKNSMKEKYLWWAVVLLGIGACFKIYPILLLPVVAFLFTSYKKRIGALILGIIPYLLMISLYLPSQGFRTYALVAGQTLKSLYAQIPISGGESIILFLAFLGFFYLVFWEIKGTVQNLWQRFFIILLLFFTFTHYHPQWFLWLTPFLIFALIKSNFRDTLAVIVSLISLTGLIFFFE
ncbi:MAG: hypothetical protein Q7S77_02340, partial [Candidatus Staskawiczbacteria bacterium]|nr:hypothetical protein [Candidatus Staskawiczbacteria bacterium]